jgi:hypothetical protein
MQATTIRRQQQYDGSSNTQATAICRRALAPVGCQSTRRFYSLNPKTLLSHIAEKQVKQTMWSQYNSIASKNILSLEVHWVSAISLIELVTHIPSHASLMQWA